MQSFILKQVRTLNLCSRSFSVKNDLNRKTNTKKIMSSPEVLIIDSDDEDDKARIANILSGKDMTKETRQQLFGVIHGCAGSMKPENYQVKTVIDLTGIEVKKTDLRLNLFTHQLVNISKPNIRDDGLDFSENFDGVQQANQKTIYLNLKNVVGQGGNQTRTIREVYHFITGQLKALEQGLENVYFANILDGDKACKHMHHFSHLLSRHEKVRENVYIGDLKSYFKWFSQLISP